MLIRRKWFPTVLAGASLLLHACGSGGGSASGGSSGGGIGGTGLVAARGPISGFGSVIVNGIEFSTQGAHILVNGADATEADLRLGMVVQVSGTREAGSPTARAETIEYARDAEGPAEIVQPGAVLRVLGQTVILGPDTRVSGDVTEGSVLEVSGLADATGAIRATYVRKKADAFEPGEEIEVKGTVTEVDAAAQTFRLQGQLVSYSAADTRNLPGGRPRNGLSVRVKSVTGVVSGVLIASKVEPEEELAPPPEETEAEIEGFVTAVASGTEFSVDGIPVDASAATFKDGGPTDIALNARVEVEGVVRSGVLIAKEVKFKSSDRNSGEGKR